MCCSSFNAAFVHDSGTAALLHDVGKLKVPPDVLSSPTKLTDSQIVLMKRHPEDGARMLMGAGRLPELAAIVAFEHHLQFDGGGYPAVPAGWKTHIASEITHIADVYDALRSDRPYRQGLPAETAAQMMTADAGRVFASGIMTLGGPLAGADTFLGLQWAAMQAVDALVAARAPGLRRLNGLGSLIQWMRWARGIRP